MPLSTHATPSQDVSDAIRAECERQFVRHAAALAAAQARSRRPA